MLPVATRLISAAPRDAIATLQRELVTRQKELASGRHADIGLEQGATIRRSINLRTALDDTETQRSLNAISQARLAGVQTALEGVSDAATDFLTTLISARDAPSGAVIMGEKGKAAASDLARALNTSVAGFHVFGGLNGDQPPVTDIETGAEGAAAKAAVNAAFQTHFGFSADDPAAAAITPAAIKGFYDGPYAALFSGANWSTLWSKASDATLQVDMSPGNRHETTSSANRPGPAELLKGFTAMAVFGQSALNTNAVAALSDAARDTVAGARGGIAAMQAGTGFAEERLENANRRLDTIDRVMSTALQKAEAVDVFDVSTRINTIMSGLEASYQMTARLQRLSLTQYL